MTESTVTYVAPNRTDAGAVPKNTVVATHDRQSDGAEVQDVYIDNVEALTQGAAESTVNTTTALLTGNATYTGTFEQNGATDVCVSCHSSSAGTLYFDFSPDGTNVNTFPTTGFSVSAGIHSFRVAVKGKRYFRVRFVNGASAQTYFRLYTYYGTFRHPNSPLNTSISSSQDALVVRSVMTGETDGGYFKNVPVDTQGHIEVALHSPRLPFGSVHAESLTPIFQVDGVYNVNTGMVRTTASGSGSVSADDASLVASTGTTALSQGVIQSVKRLRYRPGQGIVSRFTAIYTAPVAYSYQIAGIGHAEDGVYFGYADIDGVVPEFGILYVNRGKREIQTLTVTTGATSASNVTITLNGTPFTVPVTAASNIQRTVWEIATYTGYTGWDATPSGATVIFVSKSVGNKAGAMTFGAGTTGAAATFAETRAGVASVDLFIPQSTWNGDRMDGTAGEHNPSGELLDPTKYNVFQIDLQYLGAGAIVFKIEHAPAGNNADWSVVHTMQFPNTLTASTFANPSFPFTLAAYSAGSTTNLTVKTASFAGFIEGQKILQGNRFSYFRSLTTVGDTNLQALFTIYNSRTYASKVNQSVINLISTSGALKHTSPCLFYLIKNGTLAGNPNFAALATNSCSLWDTAATTVTYSTGDQLLWTGHLGDTGEFDHHFGNGSFNAEELTLQPGEWLTLAARATTGTPSYVTGSINTREDQ